MKIGILGASGRMGQLLVREVLASDGLRLAAAVVSAESRVLGQVAAETVIYTADADAAFQACDVLIDFALPASAAHHAALAAKHKKPLVIGVTGLDAGAQAAIDAAAKTAPILQSANMSLGVTLLAALVEQAAARLGEDFDIEIFEAHHRHKQDAPSGTALLLGRAAAQGRGVDPATHIAPPYPPHGAREKGKIGMSVFRGGDVVGEHTVTFAGNGERVELAHKASDRAIFARGAVRAAQWLAAQKPGKYALRDFLDI
jgi:4-hydroxy-tetrahydrodipicolinate reductase